MIFKHEQDVRLRHDRHLRIASAATGESEEKVVRKFLDQRVLLTGDDRRLRTQTGQLILSVAANLIARFCPKIDLIVPKDLSGYATVTQNILQAVDKSSSADFRVVNEPDFGIYAAVLSVGRPATMTHSTTIVDGKGWLAIVNQSGNLQAVPDQIDENPFGGLLAAALGAAEVFKYLLKPLPGKAHHFGDVTFSAFDYSINTLAPGPPLPKNLVLPKSLLAGVGAVGNAFLLSLSYVEGLRGELIVVDEEFLDDPSNLNRYLLAFEEDIDPLNPKPKTQLAIQLFHGRPIEIQTFQGPLDQALQQIYDRQIARPQVILSAVDNNEARRSLQKVWPDLVLEGATGGTTSQVSRHEYKKGLACLLCIHTIEADQGGFSYTKHVAHLSGLAEERIAASHRDGSLAVTEQDVAKAPEEKKSLLRENLGKPICSVLSELENISSANPNVLPVQPAVSFVSMISGLLMAGELVKSSSGIESALETMFQMDALFPLSSALVQPIEKGKQCYCLMRRNEIDQYRLAMQNKSLGAHLN
ncbi:MAG: ThiF family adenylyltransferase [Nitrospiraceae bacterium]